jgi:hypothetical protein
MGKKRSLEYHTDLRQGIILVKGDPLGRGRLFTPIYYSPFKGIYDKAIKDGKVFDCPIVDSVWCSRPAYSKKIRKIGDELRAKYEI